MPLFSKAVAAADTGMLDTSARPMCFGINKMVTKAAAASVGPAKFKRYEHLLYLMAQLSRIVYCDTGIAWHVIEKSLGLSNDVVNKIITAYDSMYAAKRKIPVTTQPGDGAGRPMESYSLVPSSGGVKYGTYISTPADMTCLMLDTTKVRSNPNSVLTGTDVIVVFKGSSTYDNFKHDLLSQFTATDFGQLIAATGIKVPGSGNLVTGSFVKPLVYAWAALNKALEEHVKQPNTRLFLTGHSLGGAYTTLFAFMLAEAKVSGTVPIMANVASIHVISFGAPTLFSDTARNTFNRHLDSGLVTLDRVVSQKVASRSAATQVLVGGPAGPNDVIATIPSGFAHPGYRPLATEMNPEAGGRPYSMDNIRKFYGVATKTRYREPTTWPFNEGVGLGDRKMGAELKKIVSGLTGLAVIPDEAPVTVPQAGGLGEQKGLYEKTTLARIPNFVSIEGSSYAYGFAHAEYLGMFFLGGFRLPGMKNPAATGIAYFELFPNGVKLNYLGAKGGARRAATRHRRGSRKTRRRTH